MIVVLGTILSVVALGYAAPVNPFHVTEPEKQFLVNPHRILEGNSITDMNVVKQVEQQIHSLHI